MSDAAWPWIAGLALLVLAALATFLRERFSSRGEDGGEAHGAPESPSARPSSESPSAIHGPTSSARRPTPEPPAREQS